MKRIVGVAIAGAFFIASLSGVFATDAFAARKSLGILLCSDETRYADSMNVMIRELKRRAVDLDITIERAGGNQARAVKMAKALADKRMDVYFTTGTLGLASMKNEIQETPLVFSVVYDPVGAGFVDSIRSSGNNITGVTNYVSMEKIVTGLKTLIPVKNLAVLYTPGIRNSESQLQNLQKIQDKCSIRIIPVPLNSREDAGLALPLLKDKAEAVYLTGGGVVSDAITQIIDAAIRLKMPTVTHILDYAEKGILWAEGANVKDLGVAAAEKIEIILKGVKPSDMPIAGPRQSEVYINVKTANAIGLVVPEKARQAATKVIE